MVGWHDKSGQGQLPGWQTAMPNAGDERPAEHDLKRAEDLPGSVRARLQEPDMQEDARGLRDTGALSAPTGDNHDARTRGTHQEKA